MKLTEQKGTSFEIYTRDKIHWRILNLTFDKGENVFEKFTKKLPPSLAKLIWLRNDDKELIMLQLYCLWSSMQELGLSLKKQLRTLISFSLRTCSQRDYLEEHSKVVGVGVGKRGLDSKGRIEPKRNTYFKAR